MRGIGEKTFFVLSPRCIMFECSSTRKYLFDPIGIAGSISIARIILVLELAVVMRSMPFLLILFLATLSNGDPVEVCSIFQKGKLLAATSEQAGHVGIQKFLQNSDFRLGPKYRNIFTRSEFDASEEVRNASIKLREEVDKKALLFCKHFNYDTAYSYEFALVDPNKKDVYYDVDNQFSTEIIDLRKTKKWKMIPGIYEKLDNHLWTWGHILSALSVVKSWTFEGSTEISVIGIVAGQTMTIISRFVGKWKEKYYFIEDRENAPYLFFQTLYCEYERLDSSEVDLNDIVIY
jgi:hypothetical protein